MIKFIKKMLPNNLKNKIKESYLYTCLASLRLYAFDNKRLVSNAYSVNGNYDFNNLRAKITFHYHAIEKGLSNASLRLGFGKRAFKELFWAMDTFIDKGYSTDDYRFQSAISVIDSYIRLHKEKKHDIILVEKKYDAYKKFILETNKNIGGYAIIDKNNLIDFNKLSFKELAKNRYSIRDYGLDLVDDNKIFEAINIAKKSPSACNRQPWKVYYIKSKSKINKLLTIQGGLNGYGKNLNRLIVVTCSKKYINSPLERNQPYIDGGIFCMSLIYALTSLNIATCPLHACFNIEKYKSVIKILNADMSEDIIMFISLGAYSEKIKVAKSPREEDGNYIAEID